MEDVTEGGAILWERVSELSSAGIVKIVDFGKKVPGFTQLSTGDQITLLKASCLEIMVSRKRSVDILRYVCIKFRSYGGEKKVQFTVYNFFLLSN